MSQVAFCQFEILPFINSLFKSKRTLHGCIVLHGHTTAFRLKSRRVWCVLLLGASIQHPQRALSLNYVDKVILVMNRVLISPLSCGLAAMFTTQIGFERRDRVLSVLTLIHSRAHTFIQTKQTAERTNIFCLTNAFLGYDITFTSIWLTLKISPTF